MPTFIKTGFWDKLINNNPQKAKAPTGWLNLDKFVESKIPPTPPSSVNIYNSDGTLTGNRNFLGGGNSLQLSNFSAIEIIANLTNLRAINTGIFITPNDIITNYNFSNIGLKLDFANNNYQFGDFSRINLFINSNLKLLYTADNTTQNGLYCDFGAHAYKFGRFNGGNGTHLLISDGQTYPVRLNGTTITSNTSGSTSGLYLKININNIDYVIELKNPS